MQLKESFRANRSPHENKQGIFRSRRYRWRLTLRVWLWVSERYYSEVLESSEQTRVMVKYICIYIYTRILKKSMLQVE